jgi:hypothetical protein
VERKDEHMISLEHIKKRALAHYERWLRELLNGNEVFEPLRINSIGDTAITHAKRDQLIDQLVQWQKGGSKPYGLRLEAAPPSQRSKKTESKIKAILFDSQADLIAFLDKETEVDVFLNNADLTHKQAPNLVSFCAENIPVMLKHAAIWPQLLELVALFEQDPQPQLPVRLLPLRLSDSKFIEQNNSIICKLIDQVVPGTAIKKHEKSFAKRYQLPEHAPLISCYWNDQMLQDLFHGFTQVALPLDQLKEKPLPVRNLIIIENKASIFQLLPHQLPSTCIIFGTGYAAQILSNIPWFQEKNLYYWGDLDTHGLEIYSLLKASFPHLKPLMMDLETLEAHTKYFEKSAPFKNKTPNHLSPDELNLFQSLQNENKRLEQEKIEANWIKMYLERYF